MKGLTPGATNTAMLAEGKSGSGKTHFYLNSHLIQHVDNEAWVDLVRVWQADPIPVCPTNQRVIINKPLRRGWKMSGFREFIAKIGEL